MGRSFPPSRIRHRFLAWRDRRRYPWRYPEDERRSSRRASHTFRRRFFVIRSDEAVNGVDRHIFAECPNYATATEVASLGGDAVLTESQMLDHPEHRRALRAWDKGEGPPTSRRREAGPRSGAVSPRRAPSDTFSTMEVPHG
jgi:hypothetical protein